MKKPKVESPLYKNIYLAVKQIPRGRVATYGDVARLCGLREHARLVGYALHNLKANSGVPWHRVINSKGMISLRKNTDGHDRQMQLLEMEGIKFDGGKIDLKRYGIHAKNVLLKKKTDEDKKATR